MMGDGEVAGHTTDVSAEVIIEVNVIKGLTIDGPIVLPCCENLPFLARPYTEEEKNEAARLCRNYGFPIETDVYPVQVVGSGADLNTATTNGLTRMAALTGYSIAEVKNRATITGDIQIGRLPGVVQVTMLTPASVLEKLNLLDLYQTQYP
jgi:acetamidase/formamidase